MSKNNYIPLSYIFCWGVYLDFPTDSEDEQD